MSTHLRNFNLFYLHCKWFETRSISTSSSVIVRVSVVLKGLLLVTTIKAKYTLITALHFLLL